MLNLSGIRNQSFFGKMLRKTLNLLISKNAVVPILQGPLRGMKWIVGSSVNSCWLGSYEFNKQQAILRYLKPGMVAYDIGAHAGFYTMMFSKLVGPSGEVHAFEPLPENIKFLHKHIEINRLTNVFIEPIAISNKIDEVTFHQGNDTYVGSIISSNTESMKSFEVFSITIDQYCKIRNNRLPDFIKIDVEGAESLVLAGMENLLRIKRPILFIAMHGQEVAREFSSLLKKYNYSIFNLEGNSINLHQTNTDEIIALS